jgi:hypothetical protein
MVVVVVVVVVVALCRNLLFPAGVNNGDTAQRHYPLPLQIHVQCSDSKYVN